MTLTVLWGFMAFVNGWDAFSGNAKLKTWIYFIIFVCFFIAGILGMLGLINIEKRNPEERYHIFAGFCLGWGFCLFVNWIDADFASSPQMIANLIILAVFVGLTIVQKKSIGKEKE